MTEVWWWWHIKGVCGRGSGGDGWLGRAGGLCGRGIGWAFLLMLASPLPLLVPLLVIS